MYRRLNHWVFAALLVLGQAALLIHQANIDVHAHDGQCSICLLAHGLDHAVPTQFVLQVDKSEQVPSVAALPCACVRRTSVFYQTRAPPQYPRHS